MAVPKQGLDVPFDTPTLIEICRRNDVTMVGLVGSMARGEATASSDIDLIVRFAKPKSLIGLITLEQQLTAALGREVDMLTDNWKLLAKGLSVSRRRLGTWRRRSVVSHCGDAR